MKKKVKELDKVQDDFDAKQKGRPSDQPASQESDVIPGDQLPSLWPPDVGEHVVVNFEDGWSVGEVVTSAANDSVDVSFMKLKKFTTADPEQHECRFCIWPAKKEVIATKRDHILPVRPNLVLAKPPSTRRMLVFSVNNLEIIEKFSD